MSDDEPKAPSYSRNLTAKEREDRKAQLLVQHGERRKTNVLLVAAKAKHTEAGKEVKRLERTRDTIDEMCEQLALEAETGHAVLPQQMQLGTVPVLANEDGEAIDDPRDSDDDDDDDADDDDDDDEPESEALPVAAAARGKKKAAKKKATRRNNHATA